MSKIWISSDTHFCHNKDFIYKPRGFNSVYEMNETIVKNWNSVVNWDDEIYLLGDVMLNNDEEGCKYLNRLAGKIYILGGNHDTANRIQQYVNIRPTILYLGLANIIKYQGYHFYLSHSSSPTPSARHSLQATDGNGRRHPVSGRPGTHPADCPTRHDYAYRSVHSQTG